MRTPVRTVNGSIYGSVSLLRIIVPCSGIRALPCCSLIVPVVCVHRVASIPHRTLALIRAPAVIPVIVYLRLVSCRICFSCPDIPCIFRLNIPVDRLTLRSPVHGRVRRAAVTPDNPVSLGISVTDWRPVSIRPFTRLNRVIVLNVPPACSVVCVIQVPNTAGILTSCVDRIPG